MRSTLSSPIVQTSYTLAWHGLIGDMVAVRRLRSRTEANRDAADGTHTLVVTLVYCLVFAAIAALLTWRRDVAE